MRLVRGRWMAWVMLVVGCAQAGSLMAQTEASVTKTVPPTGFASIEVLWQGEAPGAVGKNPDDVPKLYCYPAAGDGQHSAVIVLPGGGYNHLVMGKEGDVEALWLNAHGVSAYVLQYRLSPRYVYPWAMVDGERAVRLVRNRAAGWHVRPDAIGVWGFSAGGHLAGYLATADPHADARLHPERTMDEAVVQSQTYALDDVDQLSARPDFAILSYARLSLDAQIPGTFGMKSLTGDDAPQSLVDAISPVLHVTAKTSPSFIYSTEGDATVSSFNATRFYEALSRAGVPAELHVFELGPHGTGMGQNLPKQPELAIWPTLLAHWMQAHGWMEPGVVP